LSSDRLRLFHVRDAIARIRGYVTTRAIFLSDVKTQDAVARNLEIIGEAVKALSKDTHFTVVRPKHASAFELLELLP